MRKLITLTVCALFVSLTACTTPSQTPISNNKIDNKIGAIVDNVKTQEVNKLRDRFEALKSGKRLVSTAAMLGDTIDGPCTLYHEWQSFNNIKFEYDKLNYGTTDFSALLDDEVKQMAQKVTTAAYDRMKGGKLLGCVKLTNDTMTLFSNIAKLMDEYGRSAGTEAFDPAIIRAACLREIKPEVQEILATIKKYNANSDTVGWLSNYVSEAKKTWHFTPEEMGVPKAMIDRLEL